MNETLKVLISTTVQVLFYILECFAGRIQNIATYRFLSAFLLLNLWLELDGIDWWQDEFCRLSVCFAVSLTELQPQVFGSSMAILISQA